MHEWGIVKSAIEEIEKIAKEKGIKRVSKVCFALGRLDHLTADGFKFCFQILSKGTMLETTEIEIKIVKDYGLKIMKIEGEANET